MKIPKFNKKVTNWLLFSLTVFGFFCYAYTGYLFGVMKSSHNYVVLSEADLDIIPESQLNSSDAEIFIEKTVLEVLNLDFASHTTEYHLCLLGIKKGNKYLINKIATTKISYADEVKVVHRNCPKDAIINLHNHPNNVCYPSWKDKESQRKLIEELGYSEDFILGIQCNLNKFGFFKYDKYEDMLSWGIIEK